MLGAVHNALVETLSRRVLDRLAHIPDLQPYGCFDCDGHWHQAATQAQRHGGGAKMLAGHLYSLNLRQLAPPAGCNEYDVNVIKRINTQELRQDVPQGCCVLMFCDKVKIDFGFRKRSRRRIALSFLNRVKEGIVYDWLSDRVWNPEDPRNHAVQSDRGVLTREGGELRIVVYINPMDGERFEFLIKAPDLPPGEIEKVFDQIKNRLWERKAWGTSEKSRIAHAWLIALVHNLLVLQEHHLEGPRRVRNPPEDQRRLRRATEAEQQDLQLGRPITTLRTFMRRASQLSVKLIRRLRQSLRDQLTEALAERRLQSFYATRARSAHTKPVIPPRLPPNAIYRWRSEQLN